MDKKRKSTAAARRRKKRTQQNITSAAIAVAACALVVFGCTEFLNMHMNNSDNTVVYQAVLPTVLPQGTLMPVDPAYANATAAPSSESTSTTADELNSGDGWMLMLVNAENAVPDGYEPTAFTELSNGQKVDKRIYPSLQSMFDDMREQGVYPYVESGYRTSDEQQTLMEEKIAEYVDDGENEDEARELAATYVAAVGYSEHEAGLAIDIYAKSGKSTDDEVFAWLKEHCAEYGFILRYPEDKTEITGMSYEPWHYRYVGTDAAQEIMDGGLCLEEYLAAN